MSDARTHRTERSRLSLRHLLYLTAWIAIGIAVGMAYRHNRYLRQKRIELLALSKGLQVTNEDELISAAMPEITSGFYSWRVHIPDSRDYELRLGIGEVSEKGIPPIVGKVRLSPGQHRITLRRQDSVLEEFRYAVYVDGVQVIEKVMGKNWLPSDLSSATSMTWPENLNTATAATAPLQLSAQRYEPVIIFGQQYNYFNGEYDNHLTRPGYRLWIDLADQDYQPASPFLGFVGDPQFLGIGLRDGIRYHASNTRFAWEFTKPNSGTRAALLRVEAELNTVDGRKFSSHTFESWQVRNAATGSESLRWKEDPDQTVRSAFLHAKSKSSADLQPVVELQWDASKPDAIGIRLAETPANDQISRWSLRILDGKHHLWRQIQVGDASWITPEEAIKKSDRVEAISQNPSMKSAVLSLVDQSKPSVELHWKTNEALPLQIVERKDVRYSGMSLYQGLPLTFGAQIPNNLKPELQVEVQDQDPSTDGTAFPGGSVYSAIRIEVQATTRDWIWLSATSNP